ncbi:helix-turn-helix domain-containing protein [Prosthecochloris sp. N3]|uniref:Helix-turn-helix domain-containing protein n=1 Tax=Prosthecochloris ethylica TaxID=2743976 RepID=A0ABR9XNF6_9CHLB|nr:helix-turn-helix domain-containing protein [Prosthecochloris sp. ZM_2]MBF0585671.1 helix-turn-helix domain-containing protein [Prosthecochloris ethylica]MEC9487339.1 helix-turn-helix domain-containing protein [Prosthecochloris sp.]MBF0635581.1 helix-turn-helix domain-containing protein [Prosthecochloris ethylica]NUK46880.1 helix-turn-helix domain-containing protein [Prosthecochloris ethylica]RNA65381.1 helix-turn-helix domain-containing protein [Prosthecochloris sp. ZM_2]
MIFPCEKAVWYNLPQIRADIATGLVKSGMTQSLAAKKLGVTPAAVSQYINKKRGSQAVRSTAYLDEIRHAVNKIRQGASEDEVRFIVCRCCQLITEAEQEETGLCHDKS